jgi:hypothetical protein
MAERSIGDSSGLGWTRGRIRNSWRVGEHACIEVFVSDIQKESLSWKKGESRLGVGRSRRRRIDCGDAIREGRAREHIVISLQRTNWAITFQRRISWKMFMESENTVS